MVCDRSWERVAGRPGPPRRGDASSIDEWWVFSISQSVAFDSRSGFKGATGIDERERSSGPKDRPESEGRTGWCLTSVLNERRGEVKGQR